MAEKKVASEIKNLYIPSSDSHKGQNGRLLIIGGSRLFHAASLWALKVASRIVDLVHYSSVDENNRIVQKAKEEFRDGIVIPRSEVESYIEEDDCILIGPGMVRAEGAESRIKNQESRIKNIRDMEKIEDEGVQTYFLTKYLLNKYPNKKWVIDAGALQMMEPEWIPENAILTPHRGEFNKLKAQSSKLKAMRTSSDGDPKLSRRDSSDGSEQLRKLPEVKESVKWFTKQYRCIVLLKGKEDIIASEDKVEIIKGGNAGMTKGGTGDVLAGLTAALYCKNDAFLSAIAASYINKKAGEDLYKKMGYWYNASDLADQIPMTMKKLFL